MSIIKETFDKGVKILKVIKPNLIFLTGKSGTGKSYLSGKLEEVGYVPLELDLIVRKLGKKYNVGTAPDYDTAFQVYKGKGSVEIKRDFIKEIHKFIEKNIGKPIIIDGAISDPKMINKVFSKKYKVFTFVYLFPNSVSKYGERLMKRFVKDVTSNKKTLPFWSEVPEELGKKEALKSKKVKDLLKVMAKKMKKKSDKRFDSFKDAGFSIYAILV